MQVLIELFSSAVANPNDKKKKAAAPNEGGFRLLSNLIYI